MENGLLQMELTQRDTQAEVVDTEYIRYHNAQRLKKVEGESEIIRKYAKDTNDLVSKRKSYFIVVFAIIRHALPISTKLLQLLDADRLCHRSSEECY